MSNEKSICSSSLIYPITFWYSFLLSWFPLPTPPFPPIYPRLSLQDELVHQAPPCHRAWRPVLHAGPAVPLPRLHLTLSQASQAQRGEATKTGLCVLSCLSVCLPVLSVFFSVFLLLFFFCNLYNYNYFRLVDWKSEGFYKTSLP